jgi:prepilin-type processing-associated H-X9-DG protein/prepilin-type N-terminal cleavage/methylation domain-containing protein
MKTGRITRINSPHSRNFVRAFTLVELLVVIGIIAVLIGVLLPALNKARAQSQSVACLSNMRQLGQALNMFAQEHKGYLPKAWFNARPAVTKPTPGFDVQPQDYSSSDSWGYRFPMYGWDYVLLKYVNNSKGVFQCPTDTDPQYRGIGDFGLPADQLPDKPDADDIPGSYRINISDIADQAYTAVKVTQLRKASQSIVLLEGARTNDGTEPFHHVARWEPLQQGVVGPKTKKNVAWDRHAGKRSNYTFADGHAESMFYDDTWRPIGPHLFGADGNPFWNKVTMWRQRYDIPPGRTSPWPDTVQ